MYKIGHCLYYAELGEIEEEVLHQLPKIGSVAHLIPTSREGRQAQAPAVAQPGPAATATESTGDDGVDEQFVGGVLNLGGDNQTEVDGVREGVAAILNGGPPPAACYEQEMVRESCIFLPPYRSMHHQWMQFIPSKKICQVISQWCFQHCSLMASGLQSA